MSSAFTVYPQKLQGYKKDIHKSYDDLGECNDKLLSVKNNLQTCKGYEMIQYSLQRMYERIDNDRQKMDLLANNLEEIAVLYETTERLLLDAEANTNLKSIAGAEAWIISDDESFWSAFWENMEQQIVDMPEWLRILLMLMPGTQILGLLPYILGNDYLKTAFWQALAGDFTEDSNMLGVLLSVLVGIIPVVGQIADIRDLIADIYNLIDDGPETKEWVALGFTLVGILPGLGDFLKNGDEIGTVFKHVDNPGIIDDLVDGANDLKRVLGDACKKVDDGIEAVKNTKVVSAVIDKVDDLKKGISNVVKKYTPEDIQDIMNQLKTLDNIELSEGNSLGGFLKDLFKEEVNETTGIPTDLEGLVDVIIDFFDVKSSEEPKFPGIFHASPNLVAA